MQSVTGIDEIQELFDVFLIDLSGVIYDGDSLYAGAETCLSALKAAGKTIVFLSNMPRPGSVALAKLLALGIDTKGCEILTSGDLVRAQLQNPRDAVFLKGEQKFYHYGAPNNTELLAGLNVNVVEDLEEADYVLLSKFLMPHETLADSLPFLQDCLERELHLVCANPDVSTIHAGHRRYTAGHIAEEYARMGGTVHIYGKPHTQIYEAAFEHWGPDKRYLMIGDSFDTDIQGAEQAGIPSLLVMTGNTEYALSREPELSLKQYIQQYEKSTPTYVAPRFVW